MEHHDFWHQSGRLPMTEIDAKNAFLRQADARCALHGHRLTPLRRHILALLLDRGGRATAYQLLEDMQAVGPNGAGSPAPVTIYPALHFLMAPGLVTRCGNRRPIIGRRAPASYNPCFSRSR